jgi:hypothetical protein
MGILVSTLSSKKMEVIPFKTVDGKGDPQIADMEGGSNSWEDGKHHIKINVGALNRKNDDLEKIHD